MGKCWSASAITFELRLAVRALKERRELLYSKGWFATREMRYDLVREYLGADILSCLNDCEPIFVLSTGRCGTRFLTDKLNKYVSGVDVHHAPTPELAPTSVAIERLGQEFGGSNPSSKLTELLAAAFLAARLEHLRTAWLHGVRFIETNNRITPFAAGIRSVLPKARFVHLHRDPMGFVTSGMARNYFLGIATDDARRQQDSGALPVVDDRMDQIAAIAHLWESTNRQILQEAKQLGVGQLYMLPSWKLFANPRQFEAMLDWAGLETVKPIPSAGWSKAVNVTRRQALEDGLSQEEMAEVSRICLCASQLGYPV